MKEVPNLKENLHQDPTNWSQRKSTTVSTVLFPKQRQHQELAVLRLSTLNTEAAPAPAGSRDQELGKMIPNLPMEKLKHLLFNNCGLKLTIAFKIEL